MLFWCILGAALLVYGSTRAEGFRDWVRLLVGAGGLALLGVFLMKREYVKRQRALFLGGVVYPLGGVALLSLGLMESSVPMALGGSGLVLCGIWHWWVLTRPEVQAWFGPPPTDYAVRDRRARWLLLGVIALGAVAFLVLWLNQNLN
jgi:hypothetical protein